MPIAIVVGGQFGSEGKGKVSHYFAKVMEANIVVRCGGPNSGHTVYDSHGKARIFQQLPTASILKKPKLAICSGSYIDLDILFREINDTKIEPNQLYIDPNAVIITESLKTREVSSGLVQRIGSTASGTGAAVTARINREGSLTFAKDIPALKSFIVNVTELLHGVLIKKGRVIIEGTQGFGLSPIHSGFYPYATSRDTTASAFLSEVGLSPLYVDEIIMVIRAFPIRVSGNSGPLKNEIDWQTIKTEGNHKRIIEERTSVTKMLRRVGRFDPDIVKKSIIANCPTKIVLNHIDYVCHLDQSLYFEKVYSFIRYIRESINRDIEFIGLGPDHVERYEDYFFTKKVSNAR